jgi:phage terminase large subunit
MGYKDIDLLRPKWLQPIYDNYYTFIVLYGGRGGAKSFSIADYLIIKSFKYSNCYFLCAREIQSSLLSSVFSVVEKQIRDLDLLEYFNITKQGIINKVTGVKIIFKGLWRDPDSIKGIPDLKLIWIDEAANISKSSWNILPPTMTRNKDCQCIVTFNPKFTDDVVYKEFIDNNNRQNTFVKKVSYKNNPFDLPKEFYDELEALKARDYEEYLHVYEGHCITNSQTKIFKRGTYWDVLDEKTYVEHDNVELRFGLDLGFSTKGSNKHPTFGVREYVHDGSLYVTHEAVEFGLDTDLIPDFLVKYLPQVQHHTIWVDSSRPETISAINRKYVDSIKQSLFAQGVEKGPGSVEDGIEHLKSYKMIYIHPRCEKLIDNFDRYSFKTDRKGNILRDIEKANDDGIDALRYAEEQTMKNKSIDYSKWDMEGLVNASIGLNHPRNRYL